MGTKLMTPETSAGPKPGGEESRVGGFPMRSRLAYRRYNYLVEVITTSQQGEDPDYEQEIKEAVGHIFLTDMVQVEEVEA